MASKNFCDICDKPAVKQPEPIELFADALNISESNRYNHNKLILSIHWDIHNTYTDKHVNGHICSTCLIRMLNLRISKIKEAYGI